jgi:hypothetical protein
MDVVHKAKAASKLFSYLAEIRDRARTGDVPPGRVTPRDLITVGRRASAARRPSKPSVASVG